MNKSNQTSNIKQSTPIAVLNKLIEQALRYYKDEQFDIVIGICNRAIQLDPNCARAFHGKGLALIKLSRLQEALEAFDQVIQLNPKNSKIYIEKGQLCHQLGQFKEAIDIYTQAVQIDPINIVALLALGEVFFEIGRYEEAWRIYQQVIRLDQSHQNLCIDKSMDLVNLGKAFAEKEQFENASTLFQWAYRFAPYPHSHQVFAARTEIVMKLIANGNDLFELKKYDLAIANYEQAYQFDSGNVMAHMYKGKALHELERYEEALAEYEIALEKDPTNADVCLSMAKTLDKIGNFKEARKMYLLHHKYYKEPLVETKNSESIFNSSAFNFPY